MSQALLNSFLTSFFEVLSGTDHRLLAWAWATPERRTSFYAFDVLPQLTQSLVLEHKREFLLVDHVFWSESTRVPQVLVESENSPTGAVDEVRKLAALRAPVRVLLTVAQWDPGRWPAGSALRDSLLPLWRRVASEHADSYGSEGGLMAAIIGEWDPQDFLRFYVHRIDAGPVEWDASYATPFWERRISVRQADGVRAV